MWGQSCCVRNCGRRSHDQRGRRIRNGLTFHCFPAWRTNEGEHTSELTRRRRAAWVAAVDRTSITFDHIPTSARVCSRHFHSGKPAYEMLESDADWVPSLHMGHGEGNTWTKSVPPVRSDPDQIQRRTTESRHSDVFTRTHAGSGAAGGAQRPVVLPWSEVKSLLQSVLQGKPSTSRQMQTKDKSCVQSAAAKTTDLSFRDFFRNALEASLEASNRSRKTSASGSYEVELSFKLPHLTENIQTCESSSSSSSSSSCLNCVQLQRRVSELEEELLHLTAEQDMETSAVVTETLSEWMQPLSPQVVLNGRDVDQHPVVPQNRVTSSGSQRPPPRFNKAWLQMFWFLRYCPVRDEMWCQACRLHADKSYHNLGLIRGSRAFKLHNIKVHRDSSYHQANVERYKLYTSGLQPTDLTKGLSGFTELQ
ncbi:uncharacterized protein LOC113133617 [Mastacembelus armatus]|uniref:Uncharacterized LOC113133617 n=1 Tax=Mastacembelus armatus TaxID=205130 RepID=A0A7N8XCS3_9TELE|nr:uncharacterized protein LOC113133617 [Mastacembelus armatus]